MPDVKKTKRALVLGCGAVAGAAWSVAMLAELERQLGIDLREADILVGTSAGAVVAALLAAGVSVDTLVACQHGRAPGCRWHHDTDSGGAIPPLPGASLPGRELLRAGLAGRIAPFTAAFGLMPAGRTDMSAFMRLIDGVVPAGAWAPHPAAWMMAVDSVSGERVALGRDVRDMPLNRAVCASYAVPGVCPPVAHAGRVYLDGGIASPTSADVVRDEDIDEVIVLAPMASREFDRSRSPLVMIERRVRRYMTSVVDREVALLQRAGKRVIRLDPGAEDLAAFGFNMLDPARRRRVLATAERTAPQAVARALAEVDVVAPAGGLSYA